MQYSFVFSALISASLVLAKKAPVIKDKSTRGVVALADFPGGYDEKVLGVVRFTNPKGTVKVHVDMTGLPALGGPFYYHIHKDPMPENGDCLATSTHFNPFDAPADCDSQKDDSYCQVGDLSGKHGWINTTCFAQDYEDKYLSLNAQSPSYIVGKSINFHFANNTRFACANILLVDDVDHEAAADIAFDLTNGVAVEEILLGLAGENQPVDESEVSGVATEVASDGPLLKRILETSDGSASTTQGAKDAKGAYIPGKFKGDNGDDDNDDDEGGDDDGDDSPYVTTTDSTNGGHHMNDGAMAGMAMGLLGVVGALL